MQQDAGSSYYTADDNHPFGSLKTADAQDGSITTANAEGLVVATQECAPCLPATTTFKGISTTEFDPGKGHSAPFETCYQLRDEASYCWSKSSYCGGIYWVGGKFFECIPNGAAWNSIPAYYVNPVTTPNSCGTPCQHMHPDSF